MQKVLEEIPDKFLKAHDFNIDLNKVKNYSHEDASSLKSGIDQFIKDKIKRLLSASSDKISNNPDYWQLYPEIMKLLRVCMVKAIIEGEDDDFISNIKKIMQAVMYPDQNLEVLRKVGES